MNVTLPDGTVIHDIPDNITKAELTAKLSRNGYDVSKLAAPTAESTSKPDAGGMMESLRKMSPMMGLAMESPGAVAKGIGNAAAGAVRGAGSIGATAMRILPIAFGGDTASENDQRRASMDAALASMGADTKSVPFGAGKMAAEIAGTAGVGGALGAGARAAGVASPVVNALSSSGMTAGAKLAPVADLALRSGAGAAVGGVAAGAINPDDAAAGAAIGGALPSVGKLAGWLGNKAWELLTPAMQTRAVDLAKMTGDSIDDVAKQLISAVGGNKAIPGHQATVPQILQNRDISQVARTLKSSGQHALGEREAENNLAFIKAAEGIALPTGSINEARSNTGSALSDFARSGKKTADARTNAIFESINPDDIKIRLPVSEMQAGADKYAGTGYVGKGKSAVNSLMTAAKDLIGPVPFNQVQNLRASIGEAITDSANNSRRNATAALTSMKGAIDNKVGAVIGGTMGKGEVVTPEAVDLLGQGLKSHGDMKERFMKGPQAAIFRMGADGLPAKEGAEIAPMFWNSGNSQIENMQAFKKLTAGDQVMAKLMKSNAITEFLDQGAKGARGPNTPQGTLTPDAVSKWMRNHAGAAKELFSPQELDVLKAIQNETGSAGAANILGRAEGSPTAQNLFHMGALDNNKLKALANKSTLTGAAFNGLKDILASNRDNTLSELLANPDVMAAALGDYTKRNAAKNKLAAIMASPNAMQNVYRVAPATLDR